MIAWDNIVSKALLGSEKAPLSESDIPPVITNNLAVGSSLTEKEEDFFRMSALVFQFRQSGYRTSNFAMINSSQASDEVNGYCSDAANDVLMSLMDDDLFPLLELWISRCVAAKKVVHPDMAPSLLDMAVRRKHIRAAVIEVTGKRGEWLSNLNTQWNFRPNDIRVTWDTGTPEERRELLQQCRESDPDSARSLLESTWATEGANEKLAFLAILKVNLSNSDLPWLESLKEKGQKVNTAVGDLLKLISSSAIVQLYERVLSQCVRIKSGKALLGMINRTELIMDESFSFPDEIFKTGIEKLSSSKDVSDSQNIFIQLISSVPPSFWSRHLERRPAEIIDLMRKEKQTSRYLPALAIASVKFRDAAYTAALLDLEDLPANIVAALVGSVSGPERDRYAVRFFDDQPSALVQVAMNNDTEWSEELAKKILRYTAREVYQFNKTFYRPAVALIPVSMLNHIELIGPDEEQKKPYWKTQSDELTRLLNIKQQILQSFNV